MAAFVEGRLPRVETDEVTSHVRGCSDCRVVVAETGWFDEEEMRAAKALPCRWFVVAAAAAIAVAALTIPLLRHRPAPSSPVAALIEAAPREHRTVEPRVSGFPWARLEAPVRGETVPGPEDLRFSGAAGSVLERAAGDATPASQHAAGIAYLMIGRTSDSLAVLERAAQTSNDAAVWNDVAAAHYLLATAGDRPSHLPRALSAVKRAVEIDARSAEAQFNRALIVEALGLRDQAREAWQKYLQADPSSGWSNEARDRLRRLGAQETAFDFRRALQEAGKDPEALAALAHAHPEEARRWGEGPLLKEWADAEAAHDAPRAAAQLAVVRAIAHALTDGLLRDAVDTISRDGAPRSELATAHQLYDRGRADYRNRDARSAEPKLRRAAELFRLGGSPMADVASYFAANAAFEQHGGDVSELSAIYARIDRTRYRALGAQVQWQLALVANMRSDWTKAAREAGVGAATFRTLGEPANAGNLDAIAACALDLLSDRDAAWKLRLSAIASASSAQSGRRDGMLHSAALGLAATGDAPSAAAVLDLVGDAGPGGDPVLRAELLADRALIAARSGDRAEGQRRLVEARAAAATLGDDAVRESTLARIDVADAALRTRAAPAEAIVLATRSLETCRSRGIVNLVPDALLQRARAFAALGNGDAAAADYDAALQTIEEYQSTIEDENRRLAFLDTAAQVIEDAIELHLANGRVAKAFAIADGPRTLLRRPGGAARAEPRVAVDRGVAVVEYVALPKSLIVFVATAGRVRAHRVAIGRAALGARVATLAETIRRRGNLGTVRNEAAALHRLLIAPLDLDGIEELVLIPDRDLFAVPFAALYDEARKQYLVERFTIRFAPSAHEAPAPDAGALAPALVVADPPSGQWRRLEDAREEAEQIAVLHGATLLAGERATRAAFVDAASRSALIHYAGHADTDAAESYGALLLAADGGDPGLLGSGDIGRLQLPLRPLVVLAACGTFRGDPMHVGGMSSLARSFLTAGARAVVGTLWEIDDDAAAPLFHQFHEHLRVGAPPARALRSAQLDMLASSDPLLRHPATWAVVSCLAVNSNRLKESV